MQFPPLNIPIDYAVGLYNKETYDNMKLLLKHIQYSNCYWNICGDLKVIKLLLGMQVGYETKHCCIICERAAVLKSLITLKGTGRSVPGQKGVAFVDPRKIYLSPLHIKMFVKAMNMEGEEFRYLRTINDISESNIFEDPQIRHAFNDKRFEEQL